MSDPDTPDPPPGQPLEVELEPTVAGRLARWTERARVPGRVSIGACRARVLSTSASPSSSGTPRSEAACSPARSPTGSSSSCSRPHSCSSPALGLYADAVDKSPGDVAEEAGLHGLIASEVASTASSDTRWIVFVLMIPAVLYALVKLYRAIAIVTRSSGTAPAAEPAHTEGGRHPRLALLAISGRKIVRWIPRHDQLGGFSALAVYLVAVGRVARRLHGASAPRRSLASAPPGSSARRRGPPVRERLQRLCHDATRRGSCQHLRRPGNRGRAAALVPSVGKR